MVRIFIFLLFNFLFYGNYVSAQVKVTNAKGDEYIVYPDNSWELIHKNGETAIDSLDLVENTTDTTAINAQVDSAVAVKSTSIAINNETNTEDYINQKNKMFLEQIMEREKEDCSIDVQFDEFSKTEKKSTEQKNLFNHTPESLKSTLLNQHFVTSKANVFEISGNTYINILLEFNSLTVGQQYGPIDLNGQLVIKTLDEDMLTCYSQKYTSSRLDKIKGVTTYDVTYIMPNLERKILSKKEIDSIRIVYSSGFEDYEIFTIDFFMNQLNCLETEGK